MERFLLSRSDDIPSYWDVVETHNIKLAALPQTSKATINAIYK